MLQDNQDNEFPKVTKDNKKRIAGVLLTLFAVICLGAGAYLLLLTQAPRINLLKRTPTGSEKIKENRVIIPVAKIDEPIIEGGEEALDKGAWHRYPERGNPEKGGNFILSAHRFVFDTNPSAVSAKSRFYYIEKLSEGDKITVHWEGKKYTYVVSRKYQVEPDQTEIEDETDEPTMTLYSCTLGGRYDGRIVIEAKPTK